MGTTGWILTALLLVYVPVYIWTWRSTRAARYGLQIYGPLIKINTKLGTKLMDRLGRYRRFWRAFGIVSQIFALAEMAAMVLMIVTAVVRIPQTLSSSPKIGAEYILALPGLNPVMPFWYTLIALIVAVCLHEFAHGLQTRSNGMEVVNTGGLYCVVPVGAFVEPNQEQIDRASRTAKLDLFSAGISANFIIAGVALLLFSAVLLGGVPNEHGDGVAVYGVVKGSPAEDIGAGAIILEIGGERASFSELSKCVRTDHEVVVTYIIEQNGDEKHKTLSWGNYITKVTEGSPASKAGLGPGITIVKIGGKDMVPNEIWTAGQFSEFMKTTSEGDEIAVTYIETDGKETTKDIILGKSPVSSCGYLGVHSTTAGMNLIAPNEMLCAVRDPFHGISSVLDAPMAFLDYLAMPYREFDPVPEDVRWWFGGSSFFWKSVEITYWIFWLNIMLGITNAMPAVPFDGGYIFQGWVDGLLERTGHKDKAERERHAAEITKSMSSLFIFALILVVIVAIV